MDLVHVDLPSPRGLGCQGSLDIMDALIIAQANPFVKDDEVGTELAFKVENHGKSRYLDIYRSISI